MSNFILIVICIAAGMIFRATNALPENTHKGINAWVLYLALPAVSFKYLPKVQFSFDILFPVLAALIIAIGSNYFMKYYSKSNNHSQRSRRTLELASGYGNTSFLGFPLVSAFFGEKYLVIAIICDQANLMGLSTLGIISTLKAGGKKVSAKFIVKRLFTFAPFLGFILALLLSQFIDLSIAEPLFSRLAATVAPMALFSVGLQLKFTGWQKLRAQISMVMLYKLLLAPAFILGLALVIGLQGAIPKITIFEIAMPTMITSSIIAEQYGLNTKLFNLIIGISLIVGLITLALWYPVLEYLF